MSKQVRAIPDGYHTITPHLIVRGGAHAIEFYQRAFGAEELRRYPGPDGQSVMYALLKIGDSYIQLSDEFPQSPCSMRAPQSLNATTTTIHLYVTDADAVFGRAVGAGAKSSMPLMDTFWGDRYGQLTDPFGHVWSVATHKEDLTLEEIEKRAAAMFGSGSGCCKT